MKHFAQKGIMRLLFVGAIYLVSACMQTLPIRDVVNNPREYAGKQITVEGTVTAIYSLVIIKYFEISDGTATLGVVSSKPLPKKGEHIRVTGRLEEAFSLGDISMTILLEDDAHRRFIGG